MTKPKKKQIAEVSNDEMPDVQQMNGNDLSFVVSNKSKLKEKTEFDVLRDNIDKLNIDSCITITKKNEKTSMFDFKQKVYNIVFGYQRKNVEKKFKVGKINEHQIEILRTK